jgi:hypothetical protein
MILKIRIAILWIFMAVARLAHYVIVSPEEVQVFQTIMKDPNTLLFWAIFLLIPFVMAFLSVTLEDSLNRKANMIIGVIFVFFNIIHLFGCPVAHSSVHQILLVVSTVLIAILIVWYAWKWPKQRA